MNIFFRQLLFFSFNSIIFQVFALLSIEMPFVALFMLAPFLLFNPSFLLLDHKSPIECMYINKKIKGMFTFMCIFNMIIFYILSRVLIYEESLLFDSKGVVERFGWAVIKNDYWYFYQIGLVFIVIYGTCLWFYIDEKWKPKIVGSISDITRSGHSKGKIEIFHNLVQENDNLFREMHSRSKKELDKDILNGYLNRITS